MPERFSGSSGSIVYSRMRNSASQHDGARPGLSNKVRMVHIRRYFGLQLIRRKLSRFPPGMITLIPASRWLFENYHKLYLNLKAFQAKGGASCFRGLPLIRNGPDKGFPRIYMIAREIVLCTNMHVNEDAVIDLIKEYQKLRTLTTPELSILPDALILCLLDMVIDQSGRILPAIADKVKANEIMDKAAPFFMKSEEDGFRFLGDRIRIEDIRNHTYSSHLIYRLSNLAIRKTDIETFLRKMLKPGESTDEEMISGITEKERLFESDSESAISALIESLAEVSDMDADRYFSSVSVLEAMFGKDPAGVYKKMDAPTRGFYRKRAVHFARRFRAEETAVAEAVLKLCRFPPKGAELRNQDHVGTYLIGDGRSYLKSNLTGKNAPARMFPDIMKAFARGAYFVSISLVTLTVIPFACKAAGISPNHMTAPGVVFVLATIFPASAIAVFLVNALYTKLIVPQPSLAMDYEKGIPASNATFVVMPVILSSVSGAKNVIASLERHFLANRMDHLFFALLVDLKDAPSRELPEDGEIIRTAVEETQKLNQKYPENPVRFFLFYREREWNPLQKCWMGWERKRGKLEGFNALLCGEADKRFKMPVGDAEVFSGIKYVITLDADTELPQESAAKMIGVIEHPLNQPIIDEEHHRVKSGYVIVQSEIDNRIPAPSAGLFQVILSGQAGFDPYSTIVSDVYQDTFHEGIFAGKGIYHVRAFHRLLSGQIPENSVLSHDLLEGSLTRCAFASGIKLTDRVPSRIETYIKREHRWIRGDWQLLPFLIHAGRLNLLSQWKILDNLRRSVVHPALLALILANILLVPKVPWIWMPFLFFEPAVNISRVLLRVIFRKARRVFERVSASILGREIFDVVIQSVYRFMLVPVRAFSSIDAIVRTLYRILFSHRNLLEWQTADSVEKNAKSHLRSYLRLMWPSVATAAVFFYAALLPAQLGLKLAFAFFCALFILSPVIAMLSEKKIQREVRRFSSKEQIAQIRRIAVKIWRYFADHFTAENHWLCPDHIQEDPGPKKAERTSPTNIGLQLLAALSARDLGYHGLISFIENVENVLNVATKLPKWNGHLYNWYDTRTLQIIEPAYVSTVDSGNFLAHLIALKEGLEEIPEHPIFRPSLIQGLTDLLLADEEEIIDDLNRRKRVAYKKPIYAKAPRNLSVMASILRFETDESIPEERLSVFYMFIDTLMSDPTTGTQTIRFCEELILDREKLAPEQAGDLLRSLNDLADGGNRQAELLRSRIAKLCGDIRRMLSAADFMPLFDPRKRLFRIGYHVSLQKPDRGHYDLLASESRLTSFLAVAKGDVPKRHWMSLGRPLTLVRGMPALVSWSGSMFEYLMPNLVMRVPPGSIMDYSCKAAVRSQIRYARKHKIPWGISESQYFIFDNQANYQYGPFGVSRMRLQPSLKPVRVVAPYATLLALGTCPQKALANIQRLFRVGAGAQYGLYEALDFNSPDPTAMSDHSTVKSFMTHHLGMSLAAIDNMLNENILQTRFHHDPMIRANEILLEERFTSPMVTIASIGYTIDVESEEPAREEMQSRIINTVHTPVPIAHVLCNGHFQMMMTSEGYGFCAFDHIRINRWRPDRSYGGGTYVYIREPATGRLWSAAFAPVNIRPDSYQTIFSHDKVEIKRKDGPISTLTEVTVSPVDPLEIRRVTLTNHGTRTTLLEITSYLEAVADDPAADMSHPAYGKLFIETQFMPERSLLIARRRPKSDQDRTGYVLHLVRTEAELSSPVRYETSRQDFIGRGGSNAAPEALMPGNNLIGKGGASIDPIMSLQVGVSVIAGRSVSVSFVTGYCPSMNALLNLCDKLAVRLSDEDIFKLARTSSLLEIEYFKIRSVQLNAIQNLVGAIYCPTNAFREGTDDLMRNTLGQSGLWRFGVSGDRPVMLFRISELKDRSTLKEVLLAYEFLRLQKVRTDLIILNEAEGGYDDSIQQMIFEETSQVRVFEHSLTRLGIYVIRACQISLEEKTLLLAASRIIFTPQTGIYFRKVRFAEPEPAPGQIIRLTAGNHSTSHGGGPGDYSGEPVPEFFNGIGGFGRDGREYEIRLNGKTRTPAPWINVITNGRFGFQVSEIGSGYTWAGNSRENKLTVWSNDPVLDPPSEVLYVRNNQTGVVVSPCALKPGTDGTYRVRHGFGYSVFSRRNADLDLSVTVFAASEDSLKLMILTIENKTTEPADVRTALYAQWVLGAFRELTERFIITEYQSDSQILTARNTYRPEKDKGFAYLFADRQIIGFTGDRESFVGEQGSIYYPAGLLGPDLPAKVGAGLDPCGVIACDVRVAPMSRESMVFGLGYASDAAGARETAELYRKQGRALAEFSKVRQFWDKIPGNVTIRTPNRAMDILMNGWLMYQIVACRLMARAAFYQCGGAYGFRDQLQDVLAVMDHDSGITRSHILLCCSRQFVEGDVQHWWHHPDGPGVRTRISDDLLFLPYAVAKYVRHTADASVLQETPPYLETEALEPGQHERISETVVSRKRGDVYEHCVLAIDRACRFGQHGLPLIGGGDWNDGMNAVGKEGKGESVWLGWFLYHVLDLFVPICITRGDRERTDRYRRTMTALKDSLEKHAWDGQWYLRAFFDNGKPMGCARNEECRIDSISQSWAVISKAADRQRASIALRSAQRLLISQEEGIIRLLTPPFDRGENNPGYIGGYNPGIRENGGQYTHAAVWMAIAFCELGEPEEAYRLINMLNPIHATADFRLVSRYQNEPYVMTADVYDGYPNIGKGGWSWYTGAAAWMYRAILTHLLGLEREGEYLVFSPQRASPFDRYQIEYRYRSTIYEISFEKQYGDEEAVVVFFDGKKQKSQRIKLEDESTVHHIEVNF